MSTGRVARYGVLLAAGIGVVACGSESSEPTEAAELPSPLTLTGAGEELRLERAPLNDKYRAAYPNIQNLRRMDVTADRDGVIKARCTQLDGVTVKCVDTPFFTSVTRNGIETTVEIYDLYGEHVADARFTADVGRGTFAPTQTLSTLTARGGSATNEACCTKEDVSGECTPGGGPDTAVPPTPPPTEPTSPTTCSGCGPTNPKPPEPPKPPATDTGSCGETEMNNARDTFCRELNAAMKAKGLQQQVDCSHLDNKGYPKVKPPKTSFTSACSQFWAMPYSNAIQAVGRCDAKNRVTNWRDQARFEMIQEGVCKGSPLVLDLDGDGINLSSVDNGVSFDLTAHGSVRTAWTDGKDAFLALDRNGNGVIDDGTELFGNSTAGNGYLDGFAPLAELDANQDGFIDARDPVYSDLRLWADTNRDGISVKSELTTLRAAGVKRLELSAGKVEGVSSFDRHGNQIPLVSGFIKSDGSRGKMADVFFTFR